MFGQEINVHISPLGVSPASKQATFYVCKKLISPFLNKWERNLKHPQQLRPHTLPFPGVKIIN